MRKTNTKKYFVVLMASIKRISICPAKICSKHKFYLLFALIIPVFFETGCSTNNEPDEHADFVNMIYKRMDTAQNKYIDHAFSFIDSAFRALPHPGIGDIFVKDSILLTKYGFVKADHTKAIAYADSMLALLKGKTTEEKYAQRYATALYMKGDQYFGLKKYHESFNYISQAEEFAIKHVKNKCGLADYSNAKANLMITQKRYIESASYFLQQYQLLLSSCVEGYRHLMQLEASLNNVALCYLDAGICDSANKYENEALKIIDVALKQYPANNYNTLYAKAVITGDQAKVFALKKQYTEAETLYKESIAGTGAADTSFTQVLLARLADTYLKDNKPGAAKQVLDTLRNSLDKRPSEPSEIDWKQLYATYFVQINNPDSAFKYLEQFGTLTDSVAKRDKNFVEIDISNSFENLELSHTHEILERESKIKNLWIAGAAILFITAASITLLVWSNLKRTRRLHLQLQQKNEAMEKALFSLEQSHAENNRITRIVAHDLKNPVSIINNLVFSLLRKEYPENLKEIFKVIKTACSNSMVLINDVLHQKKNNAAMRTEQVDMKRLLEYCVNLLQAKATEKNQYLTLQAEDVLVMLNRQKIWRVISNIINNAIKFSPEHSAIDVKLQRKHDIVVLSVHDNGIGIPDNLKDKIFSMAPEASRAGTFGEESYGLGLTISQKIIEEHKGKIWFDSNSNGSVFYVELPCLN